LEAVSKGNFDTAFSFLELGCVVAVEVALRLKMESHTAAAI
jgi:hypothetical protein